MSDTPETDAAWDKYISHPYTYGAGDLRILAQRLERERDEARAAIPAGEWVAYKDHQKVHDAASRLLVAINKQLPIGCFILINSEYHRLQNAIYGRNEVK
jgi:hypothetical protein